MSVEAVAIALHHSRAKGAVKLVLIGIANHDGDGGSWPAVSTLATYAGVEPRTVQRAITELEKLGEVRRIVQGGGTRETADHRRPNLYQFLLQCPPDCDRSKNHRTRHRAAPVALDVEYRDGEWRAEPAPGVVDNTPPARVTPTPPVVPRVTPTPGGGVTPTSPEPSLEPGELERENPATDRARERERTWRRRCTDGSQAHRYTGDWCDYCDVHRIEDVRLTNGGSRIPI